jgi:hypothetical protein
LFQVAVAASFTSVWYWLLSVLLWVNACRVLGVPPDMVRRAADDPQVETRVDQLAHIAADRLAGLHERHGVVIAAAGGFALAVLLAVGFGYGYEAAQAAFMLAFPLAIVRMRTLRLAIRVRSDGLTGGKLRHALTRRRRWHVLIATGALTVAGMLAWAHHPYAFAH